jgi:hypothetical protein
MRKRLNVSLNGWKYPNQPKRLVVWRDAADDSGWLWEAGIFWRDRSVPIHGHRIGKLVLRWSRNG